VARLALLRNDGSRAREDVLLADLCLERLNM
jgi:hypothetical protein